MIELKNISRRYVTKGGTINALDNVSLYLENTGMVFILGKSGSGKSTLLNVIGGLDKYDDGEIIIKGKGSSSFKNSDFDSYRNTFIGFIFQEYNILEDFSVAKNIGLALELQGRGSSNEEVNKILETVDMKGLGDRKPNTLSGGQKQRVAIARALVKNPEIIMADEPTGALDSKTGKQVLDTLKKLSKDKLVIVVSHDRDFAEEYGSRIIELADGKIISDVSKNDSGDFIDSDVRQISDKTISIKQGTKLSSEDVEKINRFLSTQKSDLFLTTSEGVLKDVKIDLANKGAVGEFKDTDDLELNKIEYKAEDFKLIHSKLPLKHAFKMGASGLKVKKIRLAFTILLSVIAFAFFGVADTIGNFQRHQVATDLIINEQVENALVARYEPSPWGGYEEQKGISEGDLQIINEEYSDMNFLPVVETSFRFNVMNVNGSINYEAEQAYGLVPIDAKILSDNDFTLVAGTIPSETKQIAISKHFADQYIGKTIETYSMTQWGYNTVTRSVDSYQDFIGVSVNSNSLLQNPDQDELYTIIGVIDSGSIPSEYMGISNNDYMERMRADEYKRSSFATKIFAASEHFESIIGNVKSGNNYSYIRLYESGKQDSELHSISLYTVYILEEKETNNIFIDNNQELLKENEILINLSRLNDINTDINYITQMQTNFENALNNNIIEYDSLEYGGRSYTEIINELEWLITSEPELGKKFLNNYKSVLFNDINLLIDYIKEDYKSGDEEIEEGTLEVVGFYLGDSYNYSVKMNAETYEDITGNTSKKEYSFLIGKFNLDNRNSISEFVKFSYTYDKDGNRIGLANGILTTLDNFYAMITVMAKVFMYIGIGFAFFSALLMLNFISTSISHKKKEIGILRALGARSKDVFAIFFNESFIIALINSLIAIILTFIGIIFINRLLISELGINANMLFVSIRQILLILVISVGTAFVSSFLPVWNTARKKPIDSIRSN